MWYLLSLLVVVSQLVAAEKGAATATTAPPPRRTLDRHAAELAWRSWLQSPESGNQNAPPRRITTKSLFITPLVCPKGQRLDGNGCVEVLTVNKDAHQDRLLEQLNALFTSSPSEDIVYDYGENEPGPLQLSIPIGLDPQAAPLQSEPIAQASENAQSNLVKIDKKDENKVNLDAGIEAELQLLKLQHALNSCNDTDSTDSPGILNHNVMNDLIPKLDKPKRDSPDINSTELETITDSTEQGQKEVVYGHVNVDPVLYNIEEQTEISEEQTEKQEEESVTSTPANDKVSEIPNTSDNPTKVNDTDVKDNPALNTHVLKKDGDRTKLNPENDYADIGEAIKLISRYAEVTTDDNFSKDQKNNAMKDDSILGTRTRQQHRRNKPKPDIVQNMGPVQQLSTEYNSNEKLPKTNIYMPKEGYYRYPWQGQHSPTPPPDYPFRHLQDYWPGQSHVGGVYASHENPRRHHHKYPHNYFKLHGLPHMGSMHQGINPYPMELQRYPRANVARGARPLRSYTNNQELYSLLGLRHWFSSESTSKR